MAAIQNLFASSTDGTLAGITNISLDTIILIIIFFIFFAYGLKFGKRRIISLILSFYIAIPLISLFPYFQKISFLGDSANAMLYSQIGLFVLIVILINIILGKVVSFELYHRGVRKFIENTFLSIATGGLLIAILYHIIPITSLYNFASIIDSIFASTTIFFWWLAAPLVVIFFTTRR